MDIFQNYAAFYDTMYTEKDYGAECDFIESLWGKYGRNKVKTVLDLGCGTGGHALILAQRGYQVVGIDRSINMINQACNKMNARNLPIRFERKDIRNFELNSTFDSAIAMFAVMSYAGTNEDVLNTLRCTLKHVTSGGLFIFDVWFGPAVISKRPSDRLKIVDQGGNKIYRFAQPKLDLLNQTVNVDYTFLKLSEDHKVIETFKETHKLRFFFPQELSLLLKASGFKLQSLMPFLKPNSPINEEEWNLTVIGMKS